jgi:hypothetical protein
LIAAPKIFSPGHFADGYDMPQIHQIAAAMIRHYRHEIITLSPPAFAGCASQR